jgi:SNF2 family DNA or RNA helicase
LELAHNRAIQSARRSTTAEDRHEALNKLQSAIQTGTMADSSVDPMVKIKACKYNFVRDLQKRMGGAIIRRTTSSKTNEGELISGLPPKVVIQYLVRLTPEEHALLNQELHDVGAQTKGSMDVSFEVSIA